MRSLFVVSSLLAGGACAGPRSSRTGQPAAGDDRLFAASLAAVPSVGFTVINARKTDSLIGAQQGVVLGNGSAPGLNVGVVHAGNVRALRVDFLPLPEALPLGDFSQNSTQYINALRLRVPDLRS